MRRVQHYYRKINAYVYTDKRNNGNVYVALRDFLCPLCGEEISTGSYIKRKVQDTTRKFSAYTNPAVPVCRNCFPFSITEIGGKVIPLQEEEKYIEELEGRNKNDAPHTSIFSNDVRKRSMG